MYKLKKHIQLILIFILLLKIKCLDDKEIENIMNSNPKIIENDKLKANS
jgi:hypothetical protein